MNYFYSISILIIILIINASLLQVKLEKFNIQPTKNGAINNSNVNQHDLLNSINSQINSNKNRMNNMKKLIPIKSKKIEDISNMENDIIQIKNEIIQKKPFDYNEDIFISTAYWGGLILDDNKFNNNIKSIDKKIVITKQISWNNLQSNDNYIRFGDIFQINNFSDNLQIIGSTFGNVIIPGNRFFIINKDNDNKVLTINFCNNHPRCKLNCGNVFQWNKYWRYFKNNYCPKYGCGCNGGVNKEAVFKNPNYRGSFAKLTFKR